MKIIRQVRELYENAKEKNTRLADEVLLTLKPKSEEKKWFFLSRVKELESFALKIETGRVTDPADMEDFFACTIVVPTVHQIDDAEQLVRGIYDFSHRRPRSDELTHKDSSSFAFDDLRLYMRRQPLASGTNADLNGLLFEVQIKTILQHAWGVATHDLIYKADTASWPLERIAFQVKAMLEHAEITIANAADLSSAYAIAKQDEKTKNMLNIIAQIKAFWPQDRLPKDIKRLASNVSDLIRNCDLNIDQLTSLLEEEKKRFGLIPTDISPYAFTLQALAYSNIVNLEEKLNGIKRRNKKFQVIVHSGMDLPDWMKNEHPSIINLD